MKKAGKFLEVILKDYGHRITNPSLWTIQLKSSSDNPKLINVEITRHFNILWDASNLIDQLDGAVDKF